MSQKSGNGGEGDGDVLLPKKVTYRATSPLYVGETYKILMGKETRGVLEVRIMDKFGMVGMKGSIERFDR